ncbi:MAG: hypothetical protein EPN47_20425 [Acidobacteria bacterium]|nr:MAG: hypothetical protein EPN47_20425 [Acidobacteriota bacterium]
MQASLELQAKPLLSYKKVSRWPALALGAAILFFVLPALAKSEAKSPVPQSDAQAQTPLQEALPTGSAVRGKGLFAGRIHFQNGGPACASCHSIVGLPFPGGGKLGPDLTGVSRKLGSQGTQVAMRTLYFPVMDAVYGRQPLTPEEQADLLAFFEQTTMQTVPGWNTQIIIVIAISAFLILLLVTQYLWRDRLKSVRRKMVERAMRERRLYS